MAISLKIGILNLCLELRAHTFIFFPILSAAWTIASAALKSLLDDGNKLLVGVFSNFHILNQSNNQTLAFCAKGAKGL